MAYQGIGTGTLPNDNTGDNLRDAGIKINDNFSEIYNHFGDGTDLTAIVGTGIATESGVVGTGVTLIEFKGSAVGEVVVESGIATITVSDFQESLYGNTDVDTHLNLSSAGTNEVLSYDGSDYTWVSNAGYTNSNVDTHLNQSTATDGQVLSWNTTSNDYAWVDQSTGGSGGATDLNGLTDVTITTPSSGQVLKYNGSNWVNDTDATGGSGGISGVVVQEEGSDVGTATTINFVGTGVTATFDSGISTVSIIGIPTDTGDLTNNVGFITAGDSGAGLTALTGADEGTYGNATNTPQITVDANGRITSISAIAISGGGGGSGISGVNVFEDSTSLGVTTHIVFNDNLTATSIGDTVTVSVTGITGINTDWQGNTYVGEGAGSNFNSPEKNTLYGYYAGGNINNGDGNTCIGYSAGRQLAGGGDNVVIGAESFMSAVAMGSNVMIGYQVGQNLVTGGDNVFIGEQAGQAATYAANSTLIGAFVGAACTNNLSYSIGIGDFALNNGGNYSIGIGQLALNQNPDGQGSVAIGFRAGRECNGDYNVHIGWQAGAQSSESTGQDNVSIGRGSLDSVTSGSNNVAIGLNAGSSIATGSNNITIGYGANSGAATSNTVVIGNADITKFSIPGIGITLKGNNETSIIPGSVSFGSTISLGDDDTLDFGGDRDFKIYYDSNLDVSILKTRTSGQSIYALCEDFSIYDRSGNTEAANFTLSDGCRLNHNTSTKLKTSTDGIQVTGIVTASSSSGIVTYYGDGQYLTGINAGSGGSGDYSEVAGIATYTSEWTLGADGTSHYTFTGPGLTGAENDPALYLTRGQQYKFYNNSGGHPFRIQSTPNGSTGTQYNDGIPTNDVGAGSTLTWDVQFDAPNKLYYQCTSHPDMGGPIYIIPRTEPAVGVRTEVSGTTGSVGAGATTNLDIDGFKSYGLLKVGISSAAWVRLYVDEASRTSDADRSYLSDPSPGSGLIAEVRTETSGISTFLMTPGVIGWNNDVSIGSTIYTAVTNNESSSATITVDLTVVKMED